MKRMKRVVLSIALLGACLWFAFYASAHAHAQESCAPITGSQYNVRYRSPAPNAPTCGDFPDEVFELQGSEGAYVALVNGVVQDCESISVTVDIDCTVFLETVCSVGELQGVLGRRALQAYDWGYLGSYQVDAPAQGDFPGCSARYVLRADRIKDFSSGHGLATAPTGNDVQEYGNLFANTAAHTRIIQAYPNCAHQQSGAANSWNIDCPGTVDHFVSTSNTQDPAGSNQYVYYIYDTYSDPPSGPWNRWRIRCKSYSSEQPCVTIYGAP